MTPSCQPRQSRYCLSATTHFLHAARQTSPHPAVYDMQVIDEICIKSHETSKTQHAPIGQQRPQHQSPSASGYTYEEGEVAIGCNQAAGARLYDLSLNPCSWRQGFHPLRAILTLLLYTRYLMLMHPRRVSKRACPVFRVFLAYVFCLAV